MSVKEIHLVNWPEYHKSSVKPRGFQEFLEMFSEPYKCFWEAVTLDAKSGDPLLRIWAPNMILDQGGLGLLKNYWNSSGATFAIFNQIAITTNGASTTLTTALTNGVPVTSMAVQALPNAIAANAVVILAYGTSNQVNVTVTGAGAAQGATSIPILSFTPSVTFAIGTSVVPSPFVTDAPTSLPSAAYSGALAGGAFAFSGSGLGNRQVLITYQFNGASITAGNYNEICTVNTNPVAAVNQVASRLYVPTMAINSTVLQTINVTEKV